MLRLMPKSYATTCRRWPGRAFGPGFQPPVRALVPLIDRAWSKRPSPDPCPSARGICAPHARRRSASAFSPVMMQPASAPFSRRMRVSLRVSMSAIATTLPRCRKLLQRLGRAPVRIQRRQIANDQSGGVDRSSFEVLGIRAGVADVRISERDDLPAVGRVREDFLVARHGGVEHHLASRIAFGTDRTAVKHGAVLERQYSGLV